MNNTKYISKNPSPSYLCSDLVAALAGLDVDDFPHGCWSCGGRLVEEPPGRRPSRLSATITATYTRNRK